MAVLYHRHMQLAMHSELQHFSQHRSIFTEGVKEIRALVTWLESLPPCFDQLFGGKGREQDSMLNAHLGGVISRQSNESQQ